MCPDAPIGNTSNLQIDGTNLDVEKYVLDVQIQMWQTHITHTDEVAFIESDLDLEHVLLTLQKEVVRHVRFVY